jgi:hypothetical protein
VRRPRSACAATRILLVRFLRWRPEMTHSMAIAADRFSIAVVKGLGRL